MRAPLAILIVLVLTSLGVLVRDASAQPEPTVIRDISYYSGPDAVPRRNVLDLFIPTEHPFPLVLFFHGGEWVSGDKQEVPGERYENVAQALLAEGIGVALANYRLSDGSPESVRHPEHVVDAARALAFADSFLIARGSRASELFLMGHDSGAHLSALIATNPRFLSEHGLAPSDIGGVIGLSGIYDIEPLGSEWADVFGFDPADRLDASPVRFVEHAAADFLLFHAESDLSGRAEQANTFSELLLAAGVDSISETVAERDHHGIVRRIGEAGDPVTASIVTFVRGAGPATSTTLPTASATSTPQPTKTLTPTALPTATSSDHLPPGQPLRGPGGSERPHARTIVRHGDGWWALLTDPAPGGRFGAVVFVPDSGGFDEPGPYSRWLDHLARGGWAVIVPGGPGGGASPSVEAVGSAVADAIETLSREGGVDAEGIVWAGHGSGATTATSLAAGWFERHLPPPRALFVVSPKRHGEALPWLGPPYIPSDAPTLFMTLADAANDDPFIEPALWRATLRVPGRRRTRIELSSDRYGQPWLVADELMPLTEAPELLDALDWRGTWRALDALAACAMTASWCEEIFGDREEVENMGFWSDGRAVDAARVSEGPPDAPWIRLALPALGSDSG